MRRSVIRAKKMTGNLRDQTDEGVEREYWSHSYEWSRLENPALVEHVKDRFTELFLQGTRLGADRAPIIRRHLHLGRGVHTGRDGSPYVSASFSLTGSTYFFYDDVDQSLDDWIEEMASLQVVNYECERDEMGFTELEDWGGWQSSNEQHN